VTGDSDRKWRTALANFAESAPFLGPAGQRLFPRCFESPPLIFDAGQKTIRVAGGKSGLMMPAWMATACDNVHACHFAADFPLRGVCDTPNEIGR